MLTQVLPHPPDSGPKVKTAALLRVLAREHEITLASFTRGDQAADVAELSRVCRAVHTIPIRRGRVRDAWSLGRSLLTGESFLMARDERAAMRSLVRRLAGQEQFDVLHVDQLNMARYASAAPGAARVLDAHNALWLVTERLAGTFASGPRRVLLTREARLLRVYEGEVCSRFEGVLAVSEEDRAALEEAIQVSRRGADPPPPPIAVVPIAIDVAATPRVERRADAARVLHIGSLIWPPTVDGLTWFLSEVWPRVRAGRPGCEIDVVGGNVPSEIARRGGDAGVRVHGYVADPTPLLAGAAVMVVPLRAGGGMRVRILNGLAQGMPMVSTSIGCEGIAAEHGRHLLLADDAEGFAHAVSRLLADGELAASLAREGRRLAEEKYDVAAAARAVSRVYASAVARRVGPR